jgi:hypothetical protein
MVKSRAFLFKIENCEENDWIYVCDIKNTQTVEYVVAHSNNKCINGFIRFINPKHLNSVIMLFNNKAKVDVEQNNDLYYKEIFTKNEKHIEYGTPAKQKQRSKDCILEQLAKRDEQIDQLIRTLQENKTGESEKLKQITDICLTLAKNSPSITNNTTNNNTINNNKFNLNIFLNETCKNAINLIDFVKGIQIELQDLLLYNKVGHADAVSKIFDNAYKKLEPSMRPVHCTDVKRETVYVRDENKWLNDENKEVSEKALTIISLKSLNKMNIWKEANPDYETADDKKIEFMKLMKNVLGANTNYEEVAQTKKMIRNLAQIAQLNKDPLQIV